VNPPGNLPMIAPYWTDLTFSVPGAGSVAYQTVGGAGSRRFIAQWNKAFAQNSQTAYNFEVILFEGSNDISVQFETIQGGPANVAAGAGASVGIRDANGALNGHVLQFSYNAPVLTNNSALLFTSPATCPSIDLSSDVQVTTSAFTYNRSSKIFSGTVTVLNTSSLSLPAPLSVVLTQLSPGVTAINASATLPAGPSYSLASSLVPAGGSSAFTVQFTDPSNVRISFQPKTYGCQPAPISNE
jgi:hypothetical protein